MTAHDALVAARNDLAINGWGSYGDEPRDASASGHCALGAFHGVVRTDTRKEALAALAAAMGVLPREIPNWNDARGRSKAEVLAAFDEAIAATAPEPDTSFLTEPVKAVA